MDKSTSPSPWHGAIDGMHNNLLYGWALNVLDPNARVVLEVCLNSEVIGSVIADVMRSDLATEIKALLSESSLHHSTFDFCHGFVADLGSAFQQQNGSLTVRVANIDVILPGAIDLQVPRKPPTALTSKVFSDSALCLLGWCIDSRDAAAHQEIKAFLGDSLIAQTKANLLHPALRSYDVGSHGFELNLPLELADGVEHLVRVTDALGNELNGSPVAVCCYATGGKTLIDPDREPVLAQLLESYERYLPRSLGMCSYKEWSSLFEVAPTNDLARKKALPKLRVGIMLCAGSFEQANSHATELTQALEDTLSSLAQQDIKPQIYLQSDWQNKPAKKPRQRALPSFSSMLQNALDDQCDVIACVRVGDTLLPHALSCALEGFTNPDTQIVYTDSECAGTPWFKPAWNPEYALASDYPLELMLVRCSVLEAYLNQKAMPSAQAQFAWEMLSAVWPQAESAIVHVPRVLYQQNSALSESEKQARTESAQLALQVLEPESRLLPQNPNTGTFSARRICRHLSQSERNTAVTLIIPTRDRVNLLSRCISTLQAHTDWPNLEIIVIDNDSVETKTKTYFQRIAKQGIKILSIPGVFNFATLNNQAVDVAKGEVIGLINNDIEALHDGWLDEIMSHLLRPGVGAVGAKLLWPNGMVQHGGVLLGVGNVAAHFGNRLADQDWGDHGRNQLLQQVSSVTAACLFLRKCDYLAVGGMDGDAFPVAFNDVDLCLKLRQLGKSIIWTPYAHLLHAESASRGHEDTPQKRARAEREINIFRQRWGACLLRDPAYHPSLNLDSHRHAFAGLALPPRDRSPRSAGLFKCD
ncbi:glycosyltransferase family 2 protein [Undibacterium danionis]|uniref:Glycosyltransferase n=1 Tax=Undibacterium danionis TaxID=1812100 RepID=A0ABV6IH41_9BURK